MAMREQDESEPRVSRPASDESVVPGERNDYLKEYFQLSHAFIYASVMSANIPDCNSTLPLRTVIVLSNMVRLQQGLVAISLLHTACAYSTSSPLVAWSSLRYGFCLLTCYT